MPKLDKPSEDAKRGIVSQTDPRKNPDGIYSGMTKRLAMTDGQFVDIGGMPKDSRTMANLPHPDQD